MGRINLFLSPAMSKKRTSDESNNDEQTNEGSESPFQKEGSAKRPRLDSVSDTELQDLPIELLECILIEAIVMEVTDLKLANSAWKEKADLVISRLETVCSDWADILSTKFFQNELKRSLDIAAMVTIRLEVLDESPIHPKAHSVTAMNEEVFLLFSPTDEDLAINVYNRSSLAEPIDVLPLPPRTYPLTMAACNVSDCVYLRVAIDEGGYLRNSVLRISKDGDGQFEISPWRHDHKRSIAVISFCANGDVIIISDLHRRADCEHAIVSVGLYDEDGFLEHEVLLAPDLSEFRYHDAIQKSNGNLILGYGCDESHKKYLLEVDRSGSVLRKYQAISGEFSSVSFADVHGRIMLSDRIRGMELLDSEFNLMMDCYRLQQDQGKNLVVYDLNYVSQRNEILRIHYDRNSQVKALTTFRFKED